MTIQHKLGGIFSPVLTPFKTDLSPDTQAFVRHCQWLINSEVGLAVFWHQLRSQLAHRE